VVVAWHRARVEAAARKPAAARERLARVSVP